jgi:hypothetical protein
MCGEGVVVRSKIGDKTRKEENKNKRQKNRQNYIKDLS